MLAFVQLYLIHGQLESLPNMIQQLPILMYVASLYCLPLAMCGNVCSGGSGEVRGASACRQHHKFMGVR